MPFIFGKLLKYRAYYEEKAFISEQFCNIKKNEKDTKTKAKILKLILQIKTKKNKSEAKKEIVLPQKI